MPQLTLGDVVEIDKIDEIDEVSVVMAVAFCASIEWSSLTQTMRLRFDNERRTDYFVGDMPRLRQVIERAADVRKLKIATA